MAGWGKRLVVGLPGARRPAADWKEGSLPRPVRPELRRETLGLGPPRIAVQEGREDHELRALRNGPVRLSPVSRSARRRMTGVASESRSGSRKAAVSALRRSAAPLDARLLGPPTVGGEQGQSAEASTGVFDFPFNNAGSDPSGATRVITISNLFAGQSVGALGVAARGRAPC